MCLNGCSAAGVRPRKHHMSLPVDEGNRASALERTLQAIEAAVAEGRLL